MIVRRIWPSTTPYSSPHSQLRRMRREWESLFDALSGAHDSPRVAVFPAMNVTQDRESFYVRAELPGIDPATLDISALENKLTVAGKREIPEPAEGASYHRREREGGTFSRSLTLPSEFDPDKVTAEYIDGILAIALPKADAAKPRQIAVRTS